MTVLQGLPPAAFLPGSVFGALPIAVATGTTVTVPSAPLDISGYNTLSVFVTVDVTGTTAFSVVLVAFDPETGAAVAGSLGNLTLLTGIIADGNAAAMVYLPTYYATLSGLILPFYFAKLNLVDDSGGAGSTSVTALKLWLTNA